MENLKREIQNLLREESRKKELLLVAEELLFTIVYLEKLNDELVDTNYLQNVLPEEFKKNYLRKFEAETKLIELQNKYYNLKRS